MYIFSHSTLCICRLLFIIFRVLNIFDVLSLNFLANPSANSSRSQRAKVYSCGGQCLSVCLFSHQLIQLNFTLLPRPFLFYMCCVANFSCILNFIDSEIVVFQTTCPMFMTVPHATLCSLVYICRLYSQQLPYNGNFAHLLWPRSFKKLHFIHRCVFDFYLLVTSYSVVTYESLQLPQRTFRLFALFRMSKY